MARQLKGVLFDFDDTLIDWSGVRLSWHELEAPRLARVHAHATSVAGGNNVDARRLVDLYQERTIRAWTAARETLVAPNMPNILFGAMRDVGIDCDQLERDSVLRVYDWKVVPGTVVFPDVIPMLRMLRSAGIKLGIVTNASQPMAMRDAELAGHGLIDYFSDCRLAAADTGYLKPHRLMFEAALARFGTAPEESVFIGDNPTADIEGALAVGMRAVLRITPRVFDGGIRTATRNDRHGLNGRRSGLQASLHSLDELPAILDGWYPDWRDGGS